MDSTIKGHLAAFITVLIWGTTFISTKILQRNFSPVEILLFRFIICYFTLLAAYPQRLKIRDPKKELLFAGAGLCGVTLYFLLENIALTVSYASNVGVIISIAPFFTGILSRWFLVAEKPRPSFYIGFVVSMLGIILINFNGSLVLKLNPIGDILTICAALSWAVYSLLTKKISEYGYHTVQTTRRTFFYGILFLLPALLFFPWEWSPNRLLRPAAILNFLYLGVGASAVSFVSWNMAIRLLGAVKTSMYIYLGPAVTLFFSMLILKEPITWIAIAGTLLILCGLYISERKPKTNTAKATAESEKQKGPGVPV